MPDTGTRRQLKSPISNKTIGKCIYCGSTNNLSDEHVLAYALHSDQQLYKASCPECAGMTSQIELRVLREAYGPARHILNMRTRHKKNRKERTSYPVVMEKDGSEVVEDLPIEDFPAAIIAPVFGYPEYIAEHYRGLGISLPTGFLTAGVVAFQRPNGKDVDEIKKQYEASKVSIQSEMSWKDFARFLAKVGYGFIVAKYGLENIEEAYVLDTILGRTDDVLRYVGCQGLNRQLPNRKVKGIFHNIGVDAQRGEFVFWLRLFDNFNNAPEYIVVVGKATWQLCGLLRSVGHKNVL